MRKCELCESVAKLYCESDQASLCWECDARVHGANFLVAKHSRTLLCHLCQSLTPWTGSGSRLGPTVSVCDNCVQNSNVAQERTNENDQDGDDNDDGFDGEGGDDDDDDDEDDGGDEDDGDNQVVPWSSTSPPPPVSSSSNSTEDCSSRLCSSDDGASHSRMESSLKRIRESLESDSQDQLNLCLMNEPAIVGTPTLRPSKDNIRCTILDSKKGCFKKAKNPENGNKSGLMLDLKTKHSTRSCSIIRNG